MKTKIKLFILANLFFLSTWATAWDGTTKTAWSSVAGVNDGTSIDKPLLIQTPENLAKLAELVNAGSTYSGTYFKLVADLDLGNHNWTPIGDTGHPFSGNFDGNWHTISNLSITKWTNNIGLFGLITSATVKNLGIESGSLTCGSSNAGAIVGQSTGTAANYSVISSCYNKANLIHGATDARVYFGGIAGLMLSYTTLDHCYNRGNITNNGNAGSSQTGGIAGAIASNSSITSCYSTGVVIGNNIKGGIVGSNWTTTTYSYYNTDLCVGAGAATQAMGNTANTANVKGQTTAEMTASSFVSTLNTGGTSWAINAATYPVLIAKWDGITKTDWTVVAGVNDGTSPEKPYLIQNPEHLARLADLVNGGQTYSGKYFKLTANLDLNNKAWTSIGGVIAFSGVFDGDWHSISNLSITKWTQNIGLFGYITSATIKNLGIESGLLTCGGSNAGAIVGQATGTAGNLSYISNCYNKANLVKGATDARTYFGGIAGILLNYSTIDHCYNRGNITNDGNASSNQTGGIAGAVATGSTVFSCYSTGIVIANNIKGGVVGSNWSATSYAYYDADLCVGANAATQAMGNTANTANVKGLTTSEMTAAAFVTTINAAGTNWVANTGSYPLLSVGIVTPINSHISDNAIHIYATNHLISVDGATIGSDYLVSNVTGAILSKGIITDSKNQLTISQPGIYIVRVGNRTSKICIR
ncbi:MAG: hypothetical protein PHV20_01000 [Bacteroidales bacterium]|nr:hypothetical protein [Bacteroidales bacterium]